MLTGGMFHQTPAADAIDRIIYLLHATSLTRGPRPNLYPPGLHMALARLFKTCTNNYDGLYPEAG